MESTPIARDASIRLVAESDADALHELIEANRAYLARWMSWAPAQTHAHTVEFLRSAQEQVAADNGLQAAVVRDGDIVGMAGYLGIDWRNRSTSIGYWIGEAHQGRGTMTAAVRALVDHAILDRKLNRVEIRPAEQNRRSRAIPERLGFTEEGIAREAEWVGGQGRYLDMVLYGMLASEWPQERSAAQQLRPR